MTHDLLVVGGGPCGVSAALWARSLGLEVLVLDAGPRVGGQLHLIHFPLRNLAAAIPGDGPALASRLMEQLEEAGVETRHDSAATGLVAAGPGVRFGDGRTVTARAVLIATGARRRTLDVPGEGELEGRGVSYSSTQDRAAFAGRDIVVVGGGDAAHENALLLAEVGCRVTLVVRGVARARAEFRAAVAAEDRIRVLEGRRVTAILGASRVDAVRLHGVTGMIEQAAAGVVIKIGMRPNTEWCRDDLRVDREGFVQVDGGLATTLARVWAAGDVTRPRLPGLAISMGQGGLAAAAIGDFLRGADGRPQPRGARTNLPV